MTNPILADWQTPFEIAPFARISDEDFAPALEEALTRHSAEIDAIAQNKEAASFTNTVEALGDFIQRFFNLSFGELFVHILDRQQHLLFANTEFFSNGVATSHTLLARHTYLL